MAWISSLYVVLSSLWTSTQRGHICKLFSEVNRDKVLHLYLEYYVVMKLGFPWNYRITTDYV